MCNLFNCYMKDMKQVFYYITLQCFFKVQSRLVYCKTRDSSIAKLEHSPYSHLCRICNTVVEGTNNPLLALKTNLTDSCVLRWWEPLSSCNKRVSLVSEPCNKRILTVCRSGFPRIFMCGNKIQSLNLFSIRTNLILKYK